MRWSGDGDGDRLVGKRRSSTASGLWVLSVLHRPGRGPLRYRYVTGFGMWGLACQAALSPVA